MAIRLLITAKSKLINNLPFWHCNPRFLLTPQCADLLLDCQIDRDTRGREKPSDHVPIWVELDA